MRPLFFAPARPMKLLWKMIPYFGVLLRVFSARKSAFSAPRIWMVEAGHLARFTSRARVRDQTRAHHLADQRGEIRRHAVHALLQVVEQVLAVLAQLHHSAVEKNR